MLTLVAMVAQLGIAVSASDTIAIDQRAELRVRVTAGGTQLPTLAPPRFSPFVLTHSTGGQQLWSGTRGRVRAVVEYRYTLQPTRPGTFRIPPFVASLGSERVRSGPTTIVVRDQRSGAGMPAVVERTPLDTASSVSFHALVLPETVYVGQQATYQLGVFLDHDVRDRLRKMEAVAPEMRGMLAYDPVLPMSVLPTLSRGSRRFEAHVYQRAVFPLTAGRLVIPPARLMYALPLSASFFSREESFELRSDSTVLVAVEPPLASRPADYSGAVGRLRLEARLGESTGQVGVPISFRVRVSGQGNVKLLPRPALSIPWATVVPAEERVELDKGEIVVRGTKEFEWVLTPLRAGRFELPSVAYRYFDPTTRQYELAETTPESVSVASGALAQLDTAAKHGAQRLALRGTYRGALPPPLYARPPLWLALGLAPLPALILVTRRLARPVPRRLARARRLRELARTDATHSSARQARRAFIDAVAERIGVAPAALTVRGGLERAARRAGTTAETAAAADALLARLDMVAFDRDAHPLPDAAVRAYEIYRAIAREAGPPRRPTASIVLLVSLALPFGVLAAAALPSESERRDFARGVDAYAAGRYAEAAQAFVSLAVRVPRSADAWANAGTAAWIAGDTAHAVFGWQRALRLEPTAEDARERLALVASADTHTLGSVPRIPPTPLALLAATLWAGAWALAALWLGQRAPGAGPLALGIGVAALGLGAGAWAIDSRLAARDLAILGRATWARELPLPGVERTAVLRGGEVARIIERRGQWVRVRFDTGRDAWVEWSALLPLARD